MFMLGENRVMWLKSKFIIAIQRRIQSWTLGGMIQNWTFGGYECLFHVKGFLALLFAIRNIVVWGGGAA